MNGSTHTKSSSTQQPSQLPSDAAAADDSEATAAAFLAAISTQALKPTARKSVGRPRGTKRTLKQAGRKPTNTARKAKRGNPGSGRGRTSCERHRLMKKKCPEDCPSKLEEAQQRALAQTTASASNGASLGSNGHKTILKHLLNPADPLDTSGDTALSFTTTAASTTSTTSHIKPSSAASSVEKL
mmetsp:Transcript_3124/g.4998  ORF Transcript_3124/g.4998 Transcript_3124/m.4998 type:complete len:185 (+) Transcript_3124:188-742(+)